MNGESTLACHDCANVNLLQFSSFFNNHIPDRGHLGAVWGENHDVRKRNVVAVKVAKNFNLLRNT